ncbi:methyltransferase domain-containing protein [Rickettsiales endosymbiont of Stachyamoeba lipophora]|uniref:methyltransferase domain-containing protein n=1 Tax=Rickettsiales endosymbiont of Stachyamoeba lipophora TaxID=2486578 RepID=UPI000F64B5AB|nr:methyltransferase domain-containing protein [Rickettsiales endosymbiont of Stachyamoeba lipophora]AZL16195.1 methyltransferase domain-containing protein [Rickettsiales endosymbiont of Stachyamoeba lipophora]
MSTLKRKFEKHYSPIITAALNKIQVLYQKGDYPDAEVLIMKYLEMDPREDRLLGALALIKKKDNQIAVAKFLLEKALSYNEHPFYYYQLCVLNMEMNSLDIALEWGLKGLKVNSNDYTLLKNVAIIYYKLKDYDKAKEYYTKILIANPGDEEAKILIEAFENGKAEIIPDNIVANLFDNYANDFDTHLVQVLQYQTPTLMCNVLKKFIHLVQPNLDLKVLDLGCGTGLMAQELEKNNFTQEVKITGVDLSLNMINIARSKNLYNKLYTDDIEKYLNQENRNYHLILASDVFVYIGNINNIIKLCKQHLKSNGLLVFSVECMEADNQEEYKIITENMRFKHSENYLKRIIKEAGLQLLDIEKVIVRHNHNIPVHGLIVIAKNE